MDTALDDDHPLHAGPTRRVTHPAVRDEAAEHEGDPQSEFDGADVSRQTERGCVGGDGVEGAGGRDGGFGLWARGAGRRREGRGEADAGG